MEDFADNLGEMLELRSSLMAAPLPENWDDSDEEQRLHSGRSANKKTKKGIKRARPLTPLSFVPPRNQCIVTRKHTA